MAEHHPLDATDRAIINALQGDFPLVPEPFAAAAGQFFQPLVSPLLLHGVQCDADGQHPVDQIPALVERVLKGDADLVIGSRYVANTTYIPSFFRRLGKSILSRVVDFFIGGGITDTTSGFRAINRRALSVLARHYPEDYPEAEALVILHRSGLKAIEIPVEMFSRQGGESSIGAPQAIYYMAKVVLAIFIDMFRKFMRTPGDE